MNWNTKITDILRCQYPILSGAFAGYDNKELTAAISNAGGFGVLTASAYKNKKAFRDALKFVKKITSNPFGINFSLDQDLDADHPFHYYLAIAKEEEVNTIITAAFRVEKFGKKIKENNMIWIHKATTMRHAISGEKMGADAIILTGLEGGGLKNHNQNTFLINLVNANKFLKKPLIASGGISDGKGMLAALILGAQAVHMCTAFLATVESPIPEIWKKRIIDTDCFNSDFIEQVLHFKSNKTQYTDVSMAVGPNRKIISVSELIQMMISEADNIIKGICENSFKF